MEKARKSNIGVAVSRLADLVVGIVLGVLIAAAWLITKPVIEVEPGMPAAGPKAGAAADRHRVQFVHGRMAPVRNADWVAKEKAFAARTPGSMQLLEQEVNRWFAQTCGDADRSVKWPSFGIEINPEVPTVRFDGSLTQIAMPVTLAVMGAQRKIVLQAWGQFVSRGGAQAFVPERLCVGSCPVPADFGGAWLYDRIARSLAVSDDVAKSWAAVGSIRVEDGRMRMTIQ
jgi:hypothetical protein